MKKVYLPLGLAVGLLSAGPAHSYEQTLSDAAIKGAITLSRINEILSQYLATLQMVDPEGATKLGLHDGDRNLDARSAVSEGERLKALKDYLARLQELDKDNLTPDGEIDYGLFEARMEAEILLLSRLEPYKKRPQYYLAALDSIYGVLAKDFAPYRSRAQNALSRLEQLPGVLGEAERNLYHPPRIWVEQAIRECDYAQNAFADIVPMFKKYIGLDPMLRDRLDKAVTGAKEAIKRYRAYLAGDAMVQADGDFRAGEDIVGFYLERWHRLKLTPGAASKKAQKFYNRVHEEYLAELRKYLKTDEDNPDYSHAVLKLAKEYPNADDLLQIFQQDIDRAYQHFDKFRLFSLPKDTLKVVETPQYLAGRASFAFYSPPYPLDEVRSGELYVSVPSKKLSAKAREEMLQSNFNYPSIELVVAHEAMPGRHLYDSLSAESSRIRRISEVPALTNGWAVYAQRLAIERDFCTSDAAKLVYLRWHLVRAARAVVDIKLHNMEMTYEEAVDFLVKDTGLDPAHAKAEILRVSQSPTEAFSYVAGYEEISRLRSKFEGILERRFDIRDFHTFLLSLGKMPVTSLEGALKRKYRDYDSTLDLE